MKNKGKHKAHPEGVVREMDVTRVPHFLHLPPSASVIPPVLGGESCGCGHICGFTQTQLPPPLACILRDPTFPLQLSSSNLWPGTPVSSLLCGLGKVRPPLVTTRCRVPDINLSCLNFSIYKMGLAAPAVKLLSAVN